MQTFSLTFCFSFMINLYLRKFPILLLQKKRIMNLDWEGEIWKKCNCKNRKWNKKHFLIY